MNETRELYRLMKANPDLEVIYLIPENCCPEYGYMPCYHGRPEIFDYVDERSTGLNIFVLRSSLLSVEDQVRESVENLTTKRSNESFDAFCDRIDNIANEVIKNLKWQKAIFVTLKP